MNKKLFSFLILIGILILIVGGLLYSKTQHLRYDLSELNTLDNVFLNYLDLDGDDFTYDEFIESLESEGFKICNEDDEYNQNVEDIAYLGSSNYNDGYSHIRLTCADMDGYSLNIAFDNDNFVSAKYSYSTLETVKIGDNIDTGYTKYTIKLLSNNEVYIDESRFDKSDSSFFFSKRSALKYFKCNIETIEQN